jgi:hypothetical protein
LTRDVRHGGHVYGLVSKRMTGGGSKTEKRNEKSE